MKFVIEFYKMYSYISWLDTILLLTQEEKVSSDEDDDYTPYVPLKERRKMEVNNIHDQLC